MEEEEHGGPLLWAEWLASCPRILNDHPDGAWTASVILEKRPKRMGYVAFKRQPGSRLGMASVRGERATPGLEGAGPGGDWGLKLK